MPRFTPAVHPRSSAFTIRLLIASQARTPNCKSHVCCPSPTFFSAKSRSEKGENAARNGLLGALSSYCCAKRLPHRPPWPSLVSTQDLERKTRYSCTSGQLLTSHLLLFRTIDRSWHATLAWQSRIT